MASPPIHVIDGHVDLLIHYLDDDGISWRPARSYDISTRTEGQVDLPRLASGGVIAGLFTVAAPDPDDRAASLQASLGVLRELAREHPGELAMVPDVRGILEAIDAGRIAMLPGLEGGDQIGSSLDELHTAYGAGVRAMTLTWERTNAIGDSNADAPRHGGLSAFGRDVVGEMNRLGMLVDLSHAADSTANAVLDVTRSPVILSHSSARALCDTPRNASDALLRRVADNGGVVMVSFVPYLTSMAYRTWYLAGEEEWARLIALHPADKVAAQHEMQAWESAHPAPIVRVAEVADHVDHVRRVAGIDHVGLGSDFDGMYGHVTGLEDPSKIPVLLAELRARGWQDNDLRKLAADNFLRVFRRVETVAQLGPDRRALNERAMP